ncbi:flavodoxin family protein [Caldicellulosiruptoraceae bacterium PP1]
MKNTLIVYYSLTGNSEKIANYLSTLIDSDTERIQDLTNRKGIIAFLRSGYEALYKKCPNIKKLNADVKNYENVFVITPIWAGNIASPVRTFLVENINSIKNLTLIFTQASNEPIDINKVYSKDFNKKLKSYYLIPKQKVVSGEYKKILDN